MKIIFETFRKSIYNPVFYQGVAEEPLSKGIRYYIKFSLFLAISMTIIFSAFFIPQGVVFLKEYAPDIVKNYFPAELTIDIKNGEASVNVKEPYIVSGKDATQSFLKEQGLTSMLVIDTKHDFDKSKFDEYKTFALLTRTEIAMQGVNGQITIKKLKEAPNATISQEGILSLVGKAGDSRWYIIVGVVLGTFVIVFLGYLLYLVALFFFALVPLSVSYIKKMPISYGGAYKISLYAIVPAIVLKILVSFLGVGYVPAYFTLLVFMLLIAINMRDTKQTELPA